MAEMKKSRFHVYYADPYPYRYCFAFTPEQWDDYCRKLAKEFPDLNYDMLLGAMKTGGLTSEFMEHNIHAPIMIGVNLAQLPPDSEVYLAIGTLAHEVSHAVLNICERIGYNPVNEQEPFAYMVGQMMRHGLTRMYYDWPTAADMVAKNKKFLKHMRRKMELDYLEAKTDTGNPTV